MTEMRIHLFGDSHIMLYRNLWRSSRYHLGGYTMHRVGRDGVASLGLADRGIVDGQAIGLIFGEIDIRVHVALQVERSGRAATKVIDDLLTAYLRTIIKLRGIYPWSDIFIFSVVPPAGLDYPNFDEKYPRNGSDRERSYWTQYLNSEIERFAPAIGCFTVDQHTMFADRSGLLDKSCSDDGVHIRPALMDSVDLKGIIERVYKKKHVA